VIDRFRLGGIAASAGFSSDFAAGFAATAGLSSDFAAGFNDNAVSGGLFISGVDRAVGSGLDAELEEITWFVSVWFDCV
jgi:hypothetical protein